MDGWNLEGVGLDMNQLESKEVACIDMILGS